VALSATDKQQGRYVAVETLVLEPHTVQEIYLEGVDFPLLLAKHVFANEDGSSGVVYLVTSDTTLPYDGLTTLYRKRWNVEPYHKSLKQNASLERSPTHTVTTQTNHFFGAFLIDESGVVKQGHDRVGVAPQYCGSVGKVANAQLGVYLGYASRTGYTLLDGQLFVPELWFGAAHADKREATEMPTTRSFQTKPEIGLELLRQALARGSVRARWLAADALYGNSPAFRDGVAALGLFYFTAISCDTLIWRRQVALILPPYRGKGRKPSKLTLKTASNAPYRVDELAKRLPKSAWKRTTIKEGSKGPIVSDVAMVRVTEARDGLPSSRLWLIIRRNVADRSDVRYYLSNAPETTAAAELARMLGMRWPVELTFEQGKQEVGMDEYEVRSWQGWHHHMIMVMLAHHFLVWVRVAWKDRAPALTLNQVRVLLTSVLPTPVFDAEQALFLVQ